MTLYTPQDRIIILGSGLQVVSKASDVAPWYLAGGISAANCLAAYQPKGAASLAASYSNLANPGTYNAAPGVAPTFDASTGWTFNGSTQMANLEQGIDVSITRFVDYSQYVSGMTIGANWSKIVVTIKRSKDEEDASAVLQWQVTATPAGTDGLTVIMQAAAGSNRTNGSITVDQAGGQILLSAYEAVTSLLEKPSATQRNFYYDVVQYIGARKTQLKAGLVAIGDAVTRD